MANAHRRNMRHWWNDDPPFSSVRIEWREGKEDRFRDVWENDFVCVREAAALIKPSRLSDNDGERRRALSLPDLVAPPNVTVRSVESWIGAGRLKAQTRGGETVIRLGDLVRFALDQGFLTKPRYHLSG